MSGKLNTETKIENNIKEKLKKAPSFVSDWEQWLLATDKSAMTRKDSVNKVLRFLTYINPIIINIQPSDITEKATVNYMASIQTTGNGNKIRYTSDSYKQTVWSCLNSFMTYMKNLGYIKENYMDIIPRSKNKDLQRIKNTRIMLTQDDFKKILNAVRFSNCNMKTRDLCIIMMFMLTGIRKTALMNIDIDDIDYNKMEITIIDKGDVESKFVINKTMESTLMNWIRERDRYIIKDTNALFVSKNGERLSGNGIDKIVKKYIKEALGIELSPHKLRAGLCSILYEEKHDAEYCRRVMGHSNISTTQRYIITNNKEREDASNIMENVFVI